MENLFVKLDVNAMRGGIVTAVGGPRNFAILASIATFANSKGEAYPSQETVGEMVGLSRQTINSAIKDLLKIEVNGTPIMTKKQRKSSKGVRNVYTISPKCGFTFGDMKPEYPAKEIIGVKTKNVGVKKENLGVKNQNLGVKFSNLGVKEGLQEGEPLELEPLELEPKELEQEPKDKVAFGNPKEILEYYQQKYFEYYGVAYSPNYGRDIKLIKSKLMSTFTDEEIKVILDVAFREYSSRWETPKYKRVSIGALCSWIANEALAIAQKESQESKRAKEAERKYDLSDNQWDRLGEFL